MFVVGIDPGLSRCGYCVLDASRVPARVHALGLVTTPPSGAIPHRLAELQADIRGLFAEVRPSVVAIERVLFQVNVNTAMGVGQASGIVMVEAVAAGADVVEYSPNQVKMAVAGYGAADKAQVGDMVRRLLGLSSVPSPPDVADAAAVALCHLAMASTAAVR